MRNRWRSHGPLACSSRPGWPRSAAATWCGAGCARARRWWTGLLGAAILIGYGVIPTLQRSDFGRVYAAYGGVFVIMSLLWGWGLDGHAPDRFDWIGAALVAAGVGVIFFVPRH